jgi:uncharacterized protein (TIGR02271 family)
MAKQTSVHVERRRDGWAVVREGNQRATSVYPTQAEAAKEGREIARRDGTEFFLHAQDGRIREHNSYEEEHRPAKAGAAGQQAGTAGAVTGEASTVGRAAGAASDATRVAEESHAPETERSGRAARGDDTYSESTKYTEEVRDLATEQGGDRLAALEERYASYELHDVNGQKVGQVDSLFVDENVQIEYVGMKMGLLGTRSTLIPWELIEVREDANRMIIAANKDYIEDGPAVDDDQEITPEFEQRVYSCYRLQRATGTEERGAFGTYYSNIEEERTDLAPGERLETGEEGGLGAVASPTDRPGVTDDEELRVQRTEEELSVSTREREAGAVRLRKRVRTDRERIRVPKKRVEVTVERVPIEGEAVSAEGEIAKPKIGDDEIVVPVVEEEVVVEKRPVVKEEIRIRKEVVEDDEIIEEDVRREEVEVEDQSEQGNAAGQPDH